MNQATLTKILACPRCHSPLQIQKERVSCLKCGFKASKSAGIWELLYAPKKRLRESNKGFDSLHEEDSGGPDDGSYQILASMARGNNTLDIACGEGIIEQFAPETIGVDFSLNALKKARRSGVKYLVQAAAEALPFKDDSFELAICAGSLEHFNDPQQAIKEMARVSKIQCLTVHREFDVPFIRFFRQLAYKLLSVRYQPIEQPIRWSELEQMLKKAKLRIIFKGFWTLPVNYGRVIKFLPEFSNTPSCFFVITSRA